jgi:hypothetical protein
MRLSEFLRVFAFWKWARRLRCHASGRPCQYVDRANDNGGGRL